MFWPDSRLSPHSMEGAFFPQVVETLHFLHFSLRSTHITHKNLYHCDPIYRTSLNVTFPDKSFPSQPKRFDVATAYSTHSISIFHSDGFVRTHAVKLPEGTVDGDWCAWDSWGVSIAVLLCPDLFRPSYLTWLAMSSPCTGSHAG